MKRLRAFLGLAPPIASLFLALAGVMLLRMQFWTAGVICVLVAMATLIADVRFLDRFAVPRELPAGFWLASIPAGLWTIAICLNGFASVCVAERLPGVGDDRLAAGAWIGSVLIGLLTAWFTRSRPGRFRRFASRLAANRMELALLVAIVLVAFVVRTIALSIHPYPWSGDEASVAREASRIVNGDTTGLFHVGWSDQPYWSFVPTAAIHFLLGNTMFATRLASALIGTLAVVAVYLVARELFDGTVAVLASAFLATLPYHVHFSRLGFQNIVDSLMSSVVVWLAVRSVKTNESRDYYTAGAVAGLTIYSYPGTRLALVLAVVALLYSLYRERPGDRRRWLHVLCFFGGAALSAAPQTVFFLSNPGRFLSRLGQESILLNGWLQQRAAETGAGVARILLEQFTATVLTFVAQPAAGNTFNSPYPYLTLPESLLVLIGMGSVVAWIWTPRSFILLCWFWTVILLGGVLTMNPPAHTRLLMTTPVVAILLAIGARTIFTQIEKRGLMTARMFVPICVVMVSAIAYQNLRFYLSEYPRQMYFRDAQGEYAMEVGMMARDMGQDLHVYILGAPRVFSTFPTLRYLAPRNIVVDLTAAEVAGIEVKAGERAAFFAIPENRPLLDDLQRKHPGGSVGVVHRKTRPDQVLFDYYLVTR